jgi:hypothetical protein
VITSDHRRITGHHQWNKLGLNCAGDRAAMLNGVALPVDGGFLATKAQLPWNREVVPAAVAQNGTALAHASATLRRNREVVLAAVAHTCNGFALQHASVMLHGGPGVHAVGGRGTPAGGAYSVL